MTSDDRRLIQDDSGHWYLIPADKSDEFEDWVESMGDPMFTSYDGSDYDQYRMGGGPESITIHEWS